MDTKTVRELSRILRDFDLSEIEFESGDQRLRLAKTVVVAAAAPVAAAPVAAAPAVPPAAAPAAAHDELAGCQAITAPIPGTVYLKPNPEADLFVKSGDSVADGKVVCLIEAMKVFNEIKAEGVSGTVRKVCVEDGQPVEYGTVLFYVS